ncbi:hypothetical protein OAP56_00160 [Rickettsiaceae bacterium]|nr:hypothetical protein [Rickettsiaceae bacterium]
MSKAVTSQDINLTNLLLGIIILFLAFLSIDQKYSYIKNNERQEGLYTLIKKHASSVDLQHLKEEGRRLAFANHFERQNLTEEEFAKGNKKLLSLGSDGINAYLSLNSMEIVTGIKTYIVNSPLYLHMQPLSSFTPSSYGEASLKQISGSSNVNKNKEAGDDRK